MAVMKKRVVSYRCTVIWDCLKGAPIVYGGGD